jgi:hypothetical protein
MLTRRGALSILAFVFWGALLYLGVTVLANAFRHTVAGYPNNGQLRFYVFFPEAMTLVSACLIAVANKLPKVLFVIISLVQFALIPFYLFFYTGGV